MSFVSRLILKIRRFLIRDKRRYEVWDVSAVSNWLEKLQKKLEKEADIVIIIPKIVVEQLSARTDKSLRDRKAYDFLMSYTSSNLNFDVVIGENKPQTSNEQILSTLKKYFNKGYNVTLVTCNSALASKVSEDEINCVLLDKNIQKNNVLKSNKKEEDISMSKKQLIEEVSETEKQIQCKNVGKDTYIYAPPGIEVFDKKNKKRIGKNGKVLVRLNERVVCDGKEYVVKAITDTHIIIKKI